MMDDFDLPPLTDDEKRQFSEAFERAHAEGKISDREFARARIDGALAGWVLSAHQEAGGTFPVPDNLMDGRPPIERVGIPAVDAALPLTIKPAHVFLSALAYLMRESDKALEIAEARAKDCDEAAALLRQAAALLKKADNEPLGHMVESLAPWAERGKYGRVYPVRMEGNYLFAEQDIDALSASLQGKRGKATRDAAIIRALAQHFPHEPGFFSNGGYSTIANLAALCGATKATPAYVRSTLEQLRRTAPQPKAPAKLAGPDESLLRLFRKP